MFKQLPVILISIIYFHPVFSDLNHNHKHLYRVRHVRANSDLEVILNPGPMMAPSIIVGNFVDSKVNIEDAILEELGLATNNYGNLSQYISTTPGEFDGEIELDVDAENDLDPDEEILETSTSTTTTTTTTTQSPTTLMADDEMDEFMQNMKTPDVNMSHIVMAMGRSGRKFEDKFSSSEEISGFLDEEENEIVDDDSFFQTNDLNDPDAPCRLKLNDTSGSFVMNFSQDCTILLATPQLNSRLVLHCENVRLANCSSDRDSLIVNVNGDLKFGRNSYFYCGPNSQIRATSLKQKISLRIRRTNYLKRRPLYQCSFVSRTQRFFFPNLVTPGSANQRTNAQTSCGRIGRVSKIVGGRRVPQGLFPWMAQLDITRVDGTHTACSGSIISENYILTAAHCLKNSESISVFMGGTDRREFTGSEVTVQAEKYILHRLWNTRTLAADLALIKLTEPVTFTQEISPICLLPKTMKDENWEGKIGVGAGWGRLETKEPAPRQLYRVRLPFLPQRRCARIYRRYFNSESMMCTDSNFKAAICYGDSGGPLMYKKSEKVYQLGIASFSLSKICGESPDVFTNVGEFETWIRSRIESNYY